MRFVVLFLLFGVACVQSVPLEIHKHFKFEDALVENKAQSFVWRSEASGLKTHRVEDPVGTSAIQNLTQPFCARSIRGAGKLYGNNPIHDGLVHFNSTGQNLSLIITGVKLYCGEHLMAIQMQYNNTWGPKYGEWWRNCVYPVTHNLTFEFDTTEWFNRVDISVIAGFPWALTLHTNKRQLPTCGVPSTNPICERRKTVGDCGLFRMLVGQASVYLV